MRWLSIAAAIVVFCFVGPAAALADGTLRTYYIAADEVTWNYVQRVSIRSAASLSTKWNGPMRSTMQTTSAAVIAKRSTVNTRMRRFRHSNRDSRTTHISASSVRSFMLKLAT